MLSLYISTDIIARGSVKCLIQKIMKDIQIYSAHCSGGQRHFQNPPPPNNEIRHTPCNLWTNPQKFQTDINYSDGNGNG